MRAASIFWKKLLREAFARLEVAGEEVKRLALPAPVLHDLRGQLDPVAGHVGPGPLAHLDARQEVMEEVAELVKGRLDLAVREERGPTFLRRREVADHEPQVRRELVLTRAARDEVVHPGAAALRLAREPVGVERAQVGAVLAA